MKSIGQMIRDFNRVAKEEVGDWDWGFMRRMVFLTKNGTQTAHLKENEIERIDTAWNRHIRRLDEAKRDIDCGWE